MQTKQARGKADRIVLHFDYDCFYCSVFEKENPALKALPVGVQQKNIIATCNYPARKRGLRKLQLVKDAQSACPDLVLVNGEDLTRFREASSSLYSFLRQYSWNGRVERLGFDEVFMDVTDIVSHNLDLLNWSDLTNAFFCLDQDDPMVGFNFDASGTSGYGYPSTNDLRLELDGEAGHVDLLFRLRLASHLASHIRRGLDEHEGYTSSVGVATSKLLSKLVGTKNKPSGQTTLMPPYWTSNEGPGNVARLLDELEIQQVPGIGSKLAMKIRNACTDQSDLSFPERVRGSQSLPSLTVKELRKDAHVDSTSLEQLLCGPGAPHGIGLKVWKLVHGIDETEVSPARDIPRQISIEDTYARLDTDAEVLRELTKLARGLIKRLRAELLVWQDDKPSTSDDSVPETAVKHAKGFSGRWLAHAQTIRVSSRTRPKADADGLRVQSYNRASRSASLPNFVFERNEAIDVVAELLLHGAVIPLFRRLHPEKSGWGICLMNIAVTNMTQTAGSSKSASGRDIAQMFKVQNTALREWQVYDTTSDNQLTGTTSVERGADQSSASVSSTSPNNFQTGSEELLRSSQTDNSEGELEHVSTDASRCDICGAVTPAFAFAAHLRFHNLKE